MKRFLILSCSLLSACLSSFAMADDPAASAPAAMTASPTGMQMGGGGGPCKNIVAACLAAGFMKSGAATGKDLRENCMKPIMQGQTIAGVTVSASDVTACQAKRAAHHAMHGGGANMMPQGQQAPVQTPQ